MAKKDFVWDYAAAGDLMLRSSEIAAICEAEAARMTRATGVDYVPDVHMGKTRVIVGAKKEGNNVCPKCGKSHPNCKCNISEGV